MKLVLPLGLALAFLPLTIACADNEDGLEYQHILDLDGDAATGADVFAASCSACHGADGEGGTGPAMSDVVASHSDHDILDVVFNGSGGMPPVALEDQEAADLLAYLGETF